VGRVEALVEALEGRVVVRQPLQVQEALAAVRAGSRLKARKPDNPDKAGSPDSAVN
jgi:hypothetical protein